MKISLKQREKALPKAAIIAIGVLQNIDSKKKQDFLEDDILKIIDEISHGQFLLEAKKEDFLAKPGQIYYFTLAQKDKIQKIALLGLGDPKSLKLDTLRKSAADALKLSLGKKAASLSYIIPQNITLPHFDAIQAISEGLLLSNYRFDKYITKNTEEETIKEAIIVSTEKISSDKNQALERASILSDSICLARDLINEGPKALNPESFSEHAQDVAKKTGLKIAILDEPKLKKERMNLLLAVASAAKEIASPRLVRLSYEPKGYKKTIALIGKGVTFDSGGLNIKPADGMLDMKVDMSGAAAVLGIMKAIAQLKPKVRVVGYMALVENGIGPDAYHQGDIIISRKGLTVEINNTDAEGRLILADTFNYAIEKDNPEIMIDLATLTGACMIALGRNTAGLFSNDEDLSKALMDLGKNHGEQFWPLPLSEDLEEALKTPFADMKNCGDRYGGSITAALFLQRFIEKDVSWAHLDIAGPATNTKSCGYQTIGGAGFGIRTLVDYIMGQT